MASKLTIKLLSIFVITSCTQTPINIENNESVVIINIPDSVPGPDVLAISSVKLRRIGGYSDIDFSTLRPQVKKVKPGKYYFQTYKMIQVANVFPPKYSEPEKGRGYIIQPNTVTYLGDWWFQDTFSLNIKVEINDETLKSILMKHPELKNYPIQVAGPDGSIYKIKWPSMN